MLIYDESDCMVSVLRATRHRNRLPVSCLSSFYGAVGAPLAYKGVGDRVHTSVVMAKLVRPSSFSTPVHASVVLSSMVGDHISSNRVPCNDTLIPQLVAIPSH